MGRHVPIVAQMMAHGQMMMAHGNRCANSNQIGASKSQDAGGIGYFGAAVMRAANPFTAGNFQS